MADNTENGQLFISNGEDVSIWSSVEYAAIDPSDDRPTGEWPHCVLSGWTITKL